MSFPLLSFFSINGGLLIALVAVIHVFVAQFAVGGGLFLVMAETKAHNQKSVALLTWVERHAAFFLLLTMVFGGLTGVSIWFTTALVSPEGMSFLINRFTYIWAAEWAFFLGEIVALLLYRASFAHMRAGTISKKAHLTLAWAYFIFAFLSLATINGIMSFMLTSGSWTPESSMWVAFFNPTFWSSLVFRTFLCLCLAGLFGLLTATRIKEEQVRHTAVQMCAKWVLFPLIGLMASAVWYHNALPPETLALMDRRTADLHPFIRSFIDSAPLLMLLAIVLFIKLPRKVYPPFVAVVLLLGLIVSGSYEWIREAARRPWLVPHVIYSNGITPEQGKRQQQYGLLQASGWVRLALAAQEIPVANGTHLSPVVDESFFRTYFSANNNKALQKGQENAAITQAAALLLSQNITTLEYLTPKQKQLYGNLIFLQQCATCHGLGHPKLDVLPSVAGRGVMGIKALLSAQGTINPYMPPFFGTSAEKELFANWLNEKSVHLQPASAVLAAQMNATQPYATTQETPQNLAPQTITPLPFNAETDEYLLTAFSTTGMLFSADANPVFTLQRNGNKIAAQLIKRGTTPEVITNDITIRYTFDEHTTGRQNQLFVRSDTFLPAQETSFESKPIFIAPYTETGAFAPYPVALIEAVNADGIVLAKTQTVVPTSSEMGCKNCHTGGWKHTVGAGVSNQTGFDILAVHDKHNKTGLVALAKAGNTISCRSCHSEKTENLNLSTAIHSFHATMGLQGANACNSCHPSAETGKTHFSRDIHATWEIDCTRCHGAIQDHALALLRYEDTRGVKQARVRMQQITPTAVDSVDEIMPRKPWVNMPDCTGCHDFTAKPDVTNATAFNKWTESAEMRFSNRTENTGTIRCGSCHGSPHAVYPSTNPMGDDRDNLQPLQYQKLAMPLGSTNNCATCHIEAQEFSIHHDIVTR